MVIIDGTADPATGTLRPWRLPDDIDPLRTVVSAQGIDLLIIDPLSAATTARTDTHRDADVRRLLAALAHLARTEHLTVLAIRHLRKGATGDPRDAGIGSVAFTAAARCSWLVGSDPDQPDGPKVLTGAAANLAATPPSLAYTLAGDPEWDTARVSWKGTSSLRAPDLLRPAEDDEARSARTEAREWLKSLFESGPVLAEDAYRAWRRQGGSDQTLRRARRDLSAGVRGEGFGTDRKTWWDPPPRTAQHLDGPAEQYGGEQYEETGSEQGLSARNGPGSARTAQRSDVEQYEAGARWDEAPGADADQLELGYIVDLDATNPRLDGAPADDAPPHGDDWTVSDTDDEDPPPVPVGPPPSWDPDTAPDRIRAQLADDEEAR